MSAVDVMDEDTFYSVLADPAIQPYLFEPDYRAEENQQLSGACAQCILVPVGTAGTVLQAGELSYLGQYGTH